ncbi:MAG: restriction endonuclease subunit S [Nostoc sp. DedSLP03]|uniref:restriction endonuclease subunit S n=1 Tax=Nostoc sp. DedSLP03 TaxID=3075400 RepID=UPI002AD2A9A0|nr:restriction endonuclease subunit S [Nostoc sp. DedSLP03]MDZ7969559.1 restriction endonuclease subunit S [Nostoc sp. DedSLP03]
MTIRSEKYQDWINFFIHVNRETIYHLGSGATFPNVSGSMLAKLEIPIPPESEQKRIVAIMDEAFEGIDRAIANTEKNLANSRELFESYLNAIFTHKGDGWVEKTLGDVCEKVEYGSSAKSLVEGEIPVLRMGNIQNGAIDWSNLVYSIDKEEINKYLLKYNDVLFNRTNSDEHVGKTAIYKGEMPAIFAGYLIRIHRKEELIDADFLNFYLNSYTAREYGKSVMSRSVNQANINGTKLKSYPISLPSLSIQKQIVENLIFLRTETQRLETLYRRKLAALNELKQSILQKAFTGELTADTANQTTKAAQEAQEVNAA